MDENEINGSKLNKKEETVKKLQKMHVDFFDKVEKNTRLFFTIIIAICVFVLMFSLIYLSTKVKFNNELNVYTTKSGRNKIQFSIEESDIYINDFISSTEEIPIKKENELSSVIYTEVSNFEETENFVIQADLPNINISEEENISEFQLIKDKIKEVGNQIQAMRVVFEGNNKLTFNYYAYYYQNSLSFGYSYYETFGDKTVTNAESIVYNAETKRLMTFDEYLKAMRLDEKKISAALREIIRREKLKHKYNKRNTFFLIKDDGIVDILLEDNVTIKMQVIKD